MYLHLSKSGGTSICQLARLNQCTRAAATRDVFVTNCADRGETKSNALQNDTSPVLTPAQPPPDATLPHASPHNLTLTPP